MSMIHWCLACNSYEPWECKPTCKEYCSLDDFCSKCDASKKSPRCDCPVKLPVVEGPVN